MNAAFFLGRLLFGGFFVYNGINHFKSTKQLAQYSAAKNVPSPETAVMASGALITLGGASIILGLKPKLGAAAIMTFLATVSPSIHDFWNQEDAQSRQDNMIHFSKNLALLGAALAMAGIEEPWPLSFAR
jgi:uncharacterized membrane protein YphA (DoxX/SURF4 family)